MKFVVSGQSDTGSFYSGISLSIVIPPVPRTIIRLPSAQYNLVQLRTASIHNQKEINRSEREIDYSSPSSVEVKNACHTPSTTA